jgi:hypothetical protein
VVLQRAVLRAVGGAAGVAAGGGQCCGGRCCGRRVDGAAGGGRCCGRVTRRAVLQAAGSGAAGGCAAGGGQCFGGRRAVLLRVVLLCCAGAVVRWCCGALLL